MNSVTFILGQFMHFISYYFSINFHFVSYYFCSSFSNAYRRLLRTDKTSKFPVCLCAEEEVEQKTRICAHR